MNIKVGDRIYDKFYHKIGEIEKIEENKCIVKPIAGYDLKYTFNLSLPLINHMLFKTKFKIGDKIKNIETGTIYKIISIDDKYQCYITDSNNKNISFACEDLFERVNKFRESDLIYLQSGYSGYPESPYYIVSVLDDSYYVKVLNEFGETDFFYISFNEEHKFYTKKEKNMRNYKVGDIISHKTNNINDVITITEITPEFYIGKYKRSDGEIFDNFIIAKSKGDDYRLVGHEHIIEQTESNNNENITNMNNKFNVGDKIFPKSHLNIDIFKNGVVIKEVGDKFYTVECKSESGILITSVIPITECETNYEELFEEETIHQYENIEPVSEKYEKVNHPKHYNSHPSGVECVDIIKYMDTPTGNVIKYLWRLGLKPEEGYTQFEKDLEDAEKARWWIDIKIGMIKEQLEKQKKNE